MKKIIGKLQELYVKQKRKRQLREMDRTWNWFFGYCFDAFPPSVRLTYEKEEIVNGSKDQRNELLSMINGYAQENGFSMK